MDAIYERKQLEHGLIEPDPDNPMVHGDDDLREKELLLSEFGQVHDLIVRPHPTKDGMYMLIAGEGRWRAMGRMGRETVWCRVVTTWDPLKAHAFMLADNLRADPDDRRLVALQARLNAEGVDLALLGTDADELATMQRMLDMDGAHESTGTRGRMVNPEAQAQQVTMVLAMSHVDIVEAAIRKTGKRNRGEAFAMICQAFVDNDWLETSANPTPWMDEEF